MNQKDFELEKALDDLFGDYSSDTINNSNNITSSEINYEIIENEYEKVSSHKEGKQEIDKENNTLMFSNAELEQINSNIDIPIENLDNDYKVEEQNIFENETMIFSNDDLNENVTNIVENNNDDDVSSVKEVEDSDKQYLSEEKIVEEDTTVIPENNLDIKKIIGYFLIGILLGFLLILFLLNKEEKKVETIVNCSFTAEDENYKIIDQYKISHVNNIIAYVEGNYLYTAKTKEFENQIEFIKKDKLPAIINSNGMSGFTYIPETASNYFKVQTYLDYDAFDINAIKNINQDTTPLSFFTINVDKKYEDLKNNLEKKGFKCTLSK